MEWWQQLAEARGGGTAWEEALAAWALSPVPERQQQTLAEASQSPAQVRLLLDLFRLSPVETEPPPERARLFLSLVDESSMPLHEWIAALEVFFHWLQKQGRNTSFGLALGYIQCCSDALGGSGFSYADLPGAVSEMLENYGFDG